MTQPKKLLVILGKYFYAHFNSVFDDDATIFSLVALEKLKRSR
jgi:hypothetical protein